jgi:hypothetical protein
MCSALLTIEAIARGRKDERPKDRGTLQPERRSMTMRREKPRVPIEMASGSEAAANAKRQQLQKCFLKSKDTVGNPYVTSY